jgi:hypothetical protein
MATISSPEVQRILKDLSAQTKVPLDDVLKIIKALRLEGSLDVATRMGAPAPTRTDDFVIGVRNAESFSFV